VLDIVRNENSDKDDSATEAFIWKNMENYKGQRENFIGSVRPQSAAKDVMEIVDIF
jgi:cytochrome c556